LHELAAVACQDLVFAKADADDERKTLDMAKRTHLLGAVDRAELVVRSFRRAARDLKKPAVSDRLAGAILGRAPARTPQPTLAEQYNGSGPSDVDVVIEAGKVAGFDRRHDHASESAIGGSNPPRQLDRPLAADPPQHRLADEKSVPVGFNMDPEM